MSASLSYLSAWSNHSATLVPQWTTLVGGLPCAFGHTLSAPQILTKSRQIGAGSSASAFSTAEPLRQARAAPNMVNG